MRPDGAFAADFTGDRSGRIRTLEGFRQIARLFVAEIVAGADRYCFLPVDGKPGPRAWRRPSQPDRREIQADDRIVLDQFAASHRYRPRYGIARRAAADGHRFVRDRSHIRFPVERLGGVLGLSRQQRGLYDVLVNYLPAGSQRDFAGLPIAINRLQTGMMLPWDVTVRERGASGGAVLDVDYDAGLIDADEARRFAHCLAFLMTNSIDNIDRSIGSLPIISDEERQRFVKGVNQTAENLPQDVTLASLCADQAVRTPRDIAIVWGTEAIDYATLHARASELARRL